MKIFYNELNREVNAKLPILSLVRNNHWFLWGLAQKSRYFGYWIKDKDRVLKLVDSFEIPGLSIFDEIKKIEIVSPYFAKIYFKGNVLEILLDSQGLILKTSKPLKIKINLDFKKVYSNQQFGNNYQILPLQKGYAVNFFQEKDNYKLESYLFYEGDLKLQNLWKEVYCGFDEERNSLPYKNWVYEAFEGYFTEIKLFCPEKQISTISFDHNTICDYELSNNDRLSNFLLKRTISLYDGYFLAGLPWVSDYWFRDELIILWLFEKAVLYKTNKILLDIRNKMLNHYLENLENFALSNKPCGNNSIDIFLWILLLMDNKQIKKNLYTIKIIFGRWLNLYFQNKKIIPLEKSTWMDSIDRPRAMEIDFLFMKTLEKLSLIEKDYLKQITLEKYKQKLKTAMVTEFYPKDEMTRPNVFLAYLLEPEFLSPQKWEKLFDNVIKNSWCSWGGFSSIAKNSPSFNSKHTGEKSESYHQGDSWFWLNNIAGISMQNLNSKKYKKQIEQIKNAGLKNLLELGALGWGSELTSANELKSEGSPIQLWTMSSLIKLLE